MYFYVFDSYVQDKKYQSDVARIEARLGALGISGRTEKLTILKNINDATREVTTDTKAPLESDSQSRLTAAELERRRTAEEAERPQPKRLL